MDSKIFFIVLTVVIGFLEVSQGQYMCNTNVGARRIHETPNKTPFDCKDSNGGNTCRGGQCVAYVKCYCSRGGKYPPPTSCWRPGTKLTTPDGKCNSKIPVGTAVATFQSNGKYLGHAGAFMGCEGAYTIKLYDQWCSRALAVSSYPRGHEYYNIYYVINNSGCSEISNQRCRNETPGGSQCRA